MSDKVLKEKDLKEVTGGEWIYDPVVYYNWMCNVDGCLNHGMSWKTQSSTPGACPNCGSTNITSCGTVTEYVRKWVSKD